MDDARLAYEAYREHVGRKSVHGEALPAFDDLPPRIQEGWKAAADAVIMGVDI
jgi:hypothetical protein